VQICNARGKGYQCMKSAEKAEPERWGLVIMCEVYGSRNNYSCYDRAGSQASWMLNIKGRMTYLSCE
jgi:hypothetical protein